MFTNSMAIYIDVWPISCRQPIILNCMTACLISPIYIIYCSRTFIIDSAKNQHIVIHHKIDYLVLKKTHTLAVISWVCSDLYVEEIVLLMLWGVENTLVRSVNFIGISIFFFIQFLNQFNRFSCYKSRIINVISF